MACSNRECPFFQKEPGSDFELATRCVRASEVNINLERFGGAFSALQTELNRNGESKLTEAMANTLIEIVSLTRSKTKLMVGCSWAEKVSSNAKNTRSLLQVIPEP